MEDEERDEFVRASNNVPSYLANDLAVTVADLQARVTSLEQDFLQHMKDDNAYLRERVEVLQTLVKELKK